MNQESEMIRVHAASLTTPAPAAFPLYVIVYHHSVLTNHAVSIVELLHAHFDQMLTLGSEMMQIVRPIQLASRISVLTLPPKTMALADEYEVDDHAEKYNL